MTTRPSLGDLHAETARRRTAWRATLSLVALTLVVGSVASCSEDEVADSVPTSTSSTTVTPSESTDVEDGAGTGSEDSGDQIGPYGVGLQTLQMTDARRNRTLSVDVWYPIAPETTGAAGRYSFIPSIGFDSELAIASAAVSTEGPFPLVVYSHGSGGLRYVSTYFTEALASHGFVVIAPDHTGNTATDDIGGTRDPDEVIALNRVLDSQFVITEMLALSGAPDGAFAGSVDPDQIGITGHSFGGFTALATPVGFTNSAGSADPDPRIDTVVAMAPATRLLAPESLAALDVPTMLITGTRDETTPIEPQTTKAWDNVGARPLVRVDVIDAGHQSFTDVCDYQRLLPTIENVPAMLIEAVDEFAVEGCSAELLDIDRAHEVTNQFMISFLRTHLAGDTASARLLTEDGAEDIPEVELSLKN